MAKLFECHDKEFSLAKSIFSEPTFVEEVESLQEMTASDVFNLMNIFRFLENPNQQFVFNLITCKYIEKF